jgi:hypothetical protein
VRDARVAETLLVVGHQPHDDLIVAADRQRARTHRVDHVGEIEALGELAARVEDLPEPIGVLAEQLVPGFGGPPGERERPHHVVEPLGELQELDRTGRMRRRDQLTVADPSDALQKRGDGNHDGLLQRTMLAHGKDEDREEGRELDRDPDGDHSLLSPGQDFSASIETLGEPSLFAPVRVEEALAIEQRRPCTIGARIGGGLRPSLAPLLFGEASSQHGQSHLGGAGCGTDVRREGFVGPRERPFAAYIRLEESAVVRREIPAKPGLLVEHGHERDVLRLYRRLIPLTIRRRPRVGGSVGHHGHEERRDDEPAEEDERAAELLRERAILRK